MAMSEPAEAPTKRRRRPSRQEPDHAVALGDRHRYINRHLSWLDFDTRVLELAEDASRALLERAKFLAISSSNLDEFFQVRVGGLIEQRRAGVAALSPDGMTVEEQLSEIQRRAIDLTARQMRAFQAIVEGLGEVGLRFSNYDLARPRRSGARRCGLRGAHLPGPHPARGRPGAPVPVHQRPLAEPGRRRRSAARQRAADRSGQGPAAAAAIRRHAGRRAFRPGGAGHRSPPRPAVPGHAGRRAVPLPGHPQRRSGARGGGGRGPAHGGAGIPSPPPPFAPGGASRDRRHHDRGGQAAAHARARALGRGRLHGRRAPRPQRPLGPLRAEPARSQGAPARAGDPARARQARRRRGRGRHLPGDRRGRRARPPPVRVVREQRRGLHRPGGERSRRPRHQADALPDVGPGQPHRPLAHPRRRVRASRWSRSSS